MLRFKVISRLPIPLNVQRLLVFSKHSFSKYQVQSEDETEPSDLLGQLVESLEYKQMQVYMANNKFEKANRMLQTIINLNSFFEPQVRVFIMKQQYQIQLQLNQKEAEMCLLNILQIIRETATDLVSYFNADDVLQAETDLLLHICNHMPN